MKTKLFQDEGNKIKVCLVKRGDKYGVDDCLVHNEADPLIEFYDPRYFVRRYYLSTILEIEPGQGLCVEGNHYGYLAIEGPCLDKIKKWAKSL